MYIYYSSFSTQYSMQTYIHLSSESIIYFPSWLIQSKYSVFSIEDLLKFYYLLIFYDLIEWSVWNDLFFNSK